MSQLIAAYLPSDWYFLLSINYFQLGINLKVCSSPSIQIQVLSRYFLCYLFLGSAAKTNKQIIEIKEIKRWWNTLILSWFYCSFCISSFMESCCMSESFSNNYLWISWCLCYNVYTSEIYCYFNSLYYVDMIYSLSSRLLRAACNYNMFSLFYLMIRSYSSIFKGKK